MIAASRNTNSLTESNVCRESTGILLFLVYMPRPMTASKTKSSRHPHISTKFMCLSFLGFGQRPLHDKSLNGSKFNLISLFVDDNVQKWDDYFHLDIDLVHHSLLHSIHILRILSYRTGT
jgi:hypothetical protein